MAVRLSQQTPAYALRATAASCWFYTHRFFLLLLQQAVGCPAMARRRFFLCLAAAACCCLALLVRPVHGATGTDRASRSSHQNYTFSPRFNFLYVYPWSFRPGWCGIGRQASPALRRASVPWRTSGGTVISYPQR
jgi:hypothetical protein